MLLQTDAPRTIPACPSSLDPGHCSTLSTRTHTHTHTQTANSFAAPHTNSTICHHELSVITWTFAISDFLFFTAGVRSEFTMSFIMIIISQYYPGKKWFCIITCSIIISNYCKVDSYCHLFDWHEVGTLPDTFKDLGELRVDERIIWNTETHDNNQHETLQRLQ